MIKKFLKSSSGFTLVELLAVVFVFIIISSVTMSIIASILRGNNKTNVLHVVQSNGDYAITQMSKSIRNATAILAPYPCGTFSSPIATSAVELEFPDSTITTYSCLDNLGSNVISSNGASLIDTTNVSVSSCKFTCAQNSLSDYPIIGIDFSLSSNNASSFTEQKASSSAIEFQTSVVIRNLNR